MTMDKSNMVKTLAIGMALLLAACAPLDMPKRNQVEWLQRSYAVYYKPRNAVLSAAEAEGLGQFLASISPRAVEEIALVAHPSQALSHSRREAVAALLQEQGFGEVAVVSATSDALDKNEMRLMVGYAVVVPPVCPDWSQSPVSNPDNTAHSNMGCAFQTNLGRMVVSPKDLVGGRGDTTPDPDRAVRAVQQYKAGAVASGEDSGVSNTSTSSSGSSEGQ